MNRANFGLLFCAALSALPAQATTPVEQIFQNVAKLSPLVGDWVGDITYTDRDGSTSPETADYSVNLALDGTYLETSATLWSPNNPSKRHSFKIFTTFNPDAGKFDQTYFYSRWAIRVTEIGEFDASKHEFRTTAFIPKEDGTRDETVRTVLKFRNDGKVEYSHWSRYNDESKDLLNFKMVLTRKNESHQ